MSRNPFFWGAGLLSLAQVIALGDLAGLLAFVQLVDKDVGAQVVAHFCETFWPILADVTF